MGTFSTDSFGNDDAIDLKADIVARMMKPILLVVRRKTLRNARRHYDAARAAVQFVLSHNPQILDGPPLPPAVRALVRIRGDQEWLESWTEPADIAAAIDREIDAVIDRMASMPKYVVQPRHLVAGGRPHRPSSQTRNTLSIGCETTSSARARAKAELHECRAIVRALRISTRRVA